MFEMPNGSSLDATSEKLKEFEAIVAKLPDDERSDLPHGRTLGRRLRDRWRAIWDRSDILTPYQRSRTADQIIVDLRPLTDKVEGVTRVAYHVKTGGPPAGPPVKLSVVASDDEARVKPTNDIVFFMRTLPGLPTSATIWSRAKAGPDPPELRPLAELGLTVADMHKTSALPTTVRT